MDCADDDRQSAGRSEGVSNDCTASGAVDLWLNAYVVVRVPESNWR